MGGSEGMVGSSQELRATSNNLGLCMGWDVV